jgi:hypothetical protein
LPTGSTRAYRFPGDTVLQAGFPFTALFMVFRAGGFGGFGLLLLLFPMALLCGLAAQFSTLIGLALGLFCHLHVPRLSTTKNKERDSPAELVSPRPSARHLEKAFFFLLLAPHGLREPFLLRFFFQGLQPLLLLLFPLRFQPCTGPHDTIGQPRAPAWDGFLTKPKTDPQQTYV